MRLLLSFSALIDALNEKIGVICNWLVLVACVVSAGNAMSFGFVPPPQTRTGPATINSSVQTPARRRLHTVIDGTISRADTTGPSVTGLRPRTLHRDSGAARQLLTATPFLNRASGPPGVYT